MLEMTRSFSRRSDIDQPFEIDGVSQSLIDGWLDERLLDPRSKFAPLLELASEVGSDASIPSRVARWLLKGRQRGASGFIHMEKADRVGLEPLLRLLVALDLRQSADAVTLKTSMQRRARQMRNRRL